MAKFKNRNNELITKENIGDRKFYNSRSIAIVATVIVKYNDEVYVLLGQRGKGAPDSQGKWNVTCGYLDWDENGTAAVFREVYEETGIDLLSILTNEKTRLLHESLKEPYFVNTEIKENRQNVSLRYGVAMELDYLPKTSLEHMEPDEVEQVKWVKIEDLHQFNNEFAFEHDIVILDYMNRIIKG